MECVAMGVLRPHLISKASQHWNGKQTWLVKKKNWVWHLICLSTLPLFCSFTGRSDWKPQIKSLKTSPAPSTFPTVSGPIRRSISCPRSIASLSSPSEVRMLSTRPSPAFPMATPLVRPSSATLRSHSLSRSGSAHRVPHSNSLGTIHSNIVRYSTHIVPS